MPKSLDELAVYIPMDRRLALAQGRPLPERVHGSAIFADIDGFTSLTDQLLHELGPQRGAEELTLHLNRVYDAVIDVLHEYGASVIAFAGDAVTSWIDGDDGLRATACALDMRRAMAPFDAVETPGGNTIALTIKVVISVGSARRYQVGDPDVRLLDALAGETLVRLAQTQVLAEAGDIVMDGQTLSQIADDALLHEHRTEVESGVTGVVVHDLTIQVEPSPWPALPENALLDEHIRPWVHVPVYARMRRSLGDFLAELRPTVALFLRFGGIDYDGDAAAGDKLDAYIRWVQQVAARYEGTLIDLNIGDKGSYLYVNYGALMAHEDSSARALSSALALQSPPDALSFIGPVQIGISRGRMRVGAYGGRAHRTYGALGAEVNMAARLMMAAAPGETLVSQHAAWAAGNSFVYEEMPPLRAKGREQLLIAYRLVEARSALGPRLDGGVHDGPLVGRVDELAQVTAWLDEARDGQGKIVAIRGDAGVGKSRFAAEVLRLAETGGFSLYGGECQSYGVNANYLAWQPIWRALLEIDPRLDADQQAELVRARLAEIDPSFEPRAPLLGAVLNLPMADNELTAAMDAKTRKSALESLLVDYLRTVSRSHPVVLLLEDCHWLDPLSQDLLDAVALAVADMPLLMLLTFREPELERLTRSLGPQQSNYAELKLPLFDEEESARHIRLMLEHLYGGDEADALIRFSGQLIARIAAKAEGNPFYIVELLTYLRERNIQPDDSESATLLELPDSLHNLALSRVDRLGEYPASVLKVASIIGRLFHSDWLHQVEPALGAEAAVLGSLGELMEHNLVRPEDAGDSISGDSVSSDDLSAESVPADELFDVVYLFRQTIIQDALYASVPHQVRARTHAAIGGHIEAAYAGRQGQMLDLLAYHYERSLMREKQIEYLRRAGEAAQDAFANEAAIDYYRRLLPLLSSSESVETRIKFQIKLGDVLQLVGRWDEAADAYQAALSAATESGGKANEIRARRAMGRLLYHEKPREALHWLDEGLVSARTYDSDDVDISVAAFLVDIGWAHMKLGDLDAALDALRAGLDGLPVEPSTIRGDALSSLTATYIYRGDVQSALKFGEEALSNARSIPDLWQEQVALSNLAIAHHRALDWRGAADSLLEASVLAEQIGDKRVLAGQAVNLGITYTSLGDGAEAARHLQIGIDLARESHLLEYEFLAQQSLAELKIRTGDLAEAEALLHEMPALLESIGSDDNEIKVQRAWAELRLAGNAVAEALAFAEAAIHSAEEHNLHGPAAISQRVMGEILLADDRPERAQAILAQSYEVLNPGYLHEAARSLFHLGQAKVAIGEQSEGVAQVTEAQAIFERLGAGFDLADVEQYLRGYNISGDEEKIE